MVKSTWPGVSMMLRRLPAQKQVVVHLADLVGLTRVVEDPLGRSGLAGIDVGHDAEVAVVLDFMLSRHRLAYRS
jgi:hypothetical protein